MSFCRLQHGLAPTLLLLCGCGGTAKAPKPWADSPAQNGGAAAAEPEPSGSGGAAVELVCDDGARLCRDQAVYFCVDGGRELLLLATCSEGETCESATASCRRALCEPDQLGCEATRIVACNADGSRWEPTGQDCAADGQVCLAGECQGRPCKASTSYCQEGNVYQCDSSGLFSSVFDECDATEHCEEYSGVYAACVWNQCQPGELVCDGDYLKTCTSDGELPDEGSSCGADHYCRDAACHVRDCEPNLYFCRDDDVYYCESFGGAQLNSDCFSPETCAQLEQGAVCLGPTCQPGSTACAQNQVGVCATDGAGLSEVTLDCTAAQQVCDTSLSCAVEVTDVLGATENLRLVESGAVLGNVLDVHSSRRLLELEVNLVLAQPVDLTWLVFEQVDELNYHVRFDRLVTGLSGSGYFSSGPLDFPASAGKHYLFAVEISGASAVAYDAALEGGASFGKARAIITGSRSDAVLGDYGYDPGYQYAMRLTTELP